MSFGFDMQCMITYSFSIQFLRLSLNSMGWSSLFDSMGKTHWSISTKRIYLRHHFNNFQPARLVLSEMAVLLSVRQTVRTGIKFSHNCPSSLFAMVSLLNIIHQPSVVELNSVAHANTSTHTSTHIQTHQINGYLPPHQEVLSRRWPMEESAHSQDIQLHTCSNPFSLSHSLMFTWDQLLLHMHLWASTACVCAHPHM